MENKNYKPIQIPIQSYNLLKKYCEENGYKIGKFLDVLIKKNCKLEEKRILKVDSTYE